MTENYEKLVAESSETRRDIDIILHPQFNALKKIFELLYPGYKKSDFKRLSDLVYYQGGWPSPTTPPKEETLADTIAAALKLEEAIDRDVLVKLLKQRGVSVTLIDVPPPNEYNLSSEEEETLKQCIGEADVEGVFPKERNEGLKKLIERAQELQAEICQQADLIKVDAAAVAEEKYKIKKPNFVKAVGLGSVKLRAGEDKMAEKLKKMLDGVDNVHAAVAPLQK